MVIKPRSLATVCLLLLSVGLLSSVVRSHAADEAAAAALASAHPAGMHILDWLEANAGVTVPRPASAGIAAVGMRQHRPTDTAAAVRPCV